MAASCSSIVYGVIPILPQPRTRFKTLNFPIIHPQLLSSNSCLTSTSKFLYPKLQISGSRYRNSNTPVIVAVQSNILKVFQTFLKIGKDGIEAGTNLVPDVVPRPVARVSIGVLASAVTLFVVRSILSTVFFTVAFMGFVYFVYLALNKDKGPDLDDKPGSTDEAVEEARKIMEKYK
ncbi:unnamed protein product [Amaranthus hypochondriacus]